MITRFIMAAALILISISNVSAAPNQPSNACFEQAANRYHVPVNLLRAISKTESSGNANAIHINGKGSKDIGHMQINSAWLPKLAKYGITQQDLLNPCVCTHVGAWILAGNISRLGYNWSAIGAYNASLRTAESRNKAAIYIRKVAANLYSQDGGKAID